MSDKTKFPRADAIAVAKEIVAALKPHCVEDRLVIAGSLRRSKMQVGDVEVLYIPKFVERKNKVDLFRATVQVNAVDEALDALLKSGVIVKRPNVKGHTCWGPSNKLAVHKASGIPVDFFATTLHNWYVALVIRTGGKQMNLALTNGAIKLGRTLHAYGSGVEGRDGYVHCDSEEKVFAMCGCRYREPHLRP